MLASILSLTILEKAKKESLKINGKVQKRHTFCLRLQAGTGRSAKKGHSGFISCLPHRLKVNGVGRLAFKVLVDVY